MRQWARLPEYSDHTKAVPRYTTTSFESAPDRGGRLTEKQWNPVVQLIF